MRKEIIKFRYSFLLLLFFQTGLLAQTKTEQNSFIRLCKTRSFLISNPAPQYVVEINKDTTISFYNNLPQNFSEHGTVLIKTWIIDSTTVLLDSSDFNELIRLIDSIDFESIDILNKESKNELRMYVSGTCPDNYIIEFTNQKVEYKYDRNNEKFITASAKRIRKLIEAMETKYKPKK